ncbi:MAG TPA: hypothetical protein VLT33_16125 [Labilithrix sp.]|nr:hypothetical protein [Labilithrix sp.]
MGETRANVLLVGTGVVGSALLGILQGDAPPEGLALVGLANRRGAVLGERPLAQAETRELVSRAAGSATAALEDDLLDALAARPHPVLVDATASDGMLDLYVRALARGIHVVTANKKPLAAAWSERQRLFAPSLATRGARLRYEATVGAGLPVIETLKDLVRTGDRVRKIECVLSGTLGFLANELQAGTPLSRAVAVAKDRGYTEPDPREDLGGADVARKAVVLARELGSSLETVDVELVPFVPAAVLGASSAATLIRDLERIDGEVAARVERLKARGEKLVYLARIDHAGASAAPVAVRLDHPAATLGGSSALVAFTTDRYDRDPLVVRGAGAGGPVTAAALIADILKAVDRA